MSLSEAKAMTELRQSAKSTESQLAEIQIAGNDFEKMLELRVKLITIYTKLKQYELANYLLDDSKATFPDNKKLLELTDLVKAEELKKNTMEGK